MMARPRSVNLEQPFRIRVDGEGRSEVAADEFLAISRIIVFKAKSTSMDSPPVRVISCHRSEFQARK